MMNSSRWTQRLSLLAVVGAAVAVAAGPALAAERDESQLLGQWDAVIAHCGDMAPKLKPLLEARTQALFAQASDDLLAQVRQRTAYKETRTQSTASFLRESKEQAAKMCRELAGADE